MGIIWQEAVLHTKVSLREKHSIFWAYLFPVMMLVLFCSVFGSGPAEATALLVGVICINSMSGSLYGVGVNIVSLREQKVLRRFKVTPAPLWKIILGLSLAQVGIMTVGNLLLIIAAKTLYKVSLPPDAGAFLLVFTVGTFMFCTLAFVIASVAKSGSHANGLAQISFMPMMFLSGATLPVEAMPVWVQKTAMLLPATYYVAGLRRAYEGEVQGNLVNLAVMAAFSLVAVWVSVKFFRWE
jgi:ABC-2 type transport system permease protein